MIVVAEAEIWLPPGACLGGQFPFGLCNFGQSLAPRAVAVACTTLAALALLGRRRWPLHALGLIAGLSVLVALVWVASPGLGYYLPLLIAAYSLGRYHRGRHPWLMLAGATFILFATSVIHDLRVPGQAPNGSLATFYIVLLGALPVGRMLQAQDLRAELADAEMREARQAQDAVARRAVEEERARIARELHDVAAHGASLIVVQSVAAQGTFDSEPGRARPALEAIESEARAMLMEMRHLVDGLRSDQVAGSSNLEQLVERVRAAGQPVEARLETGHLDEVMELTLYRCIQEALTNAVKHAPGAATKVVVQCSEAVLEATVENGPADPHRSRAPASGSGHGLTGMRERVTRLGGTVVAKPAAGGGFRLQVSIPIGGPT